MLNFHRVAQLLFPSVPPQDQARVLAAMECNTTQSPVSERLGEGRDEAGQSEGGDGRSLSFSPPPSSGAPSCERGQSTPVHPAHRIHLEDHHLARLLDQWGDPS